MDTPTVLANTIDDSSTEVWVRFSIGLVLTIADKERILDGEKLNDRHIDLAQNLLNHLMACLEKGQFSPFPCNCLAILSSVLHLGIPHANSFVSIHIQLFIWLTY